MQTLPLFFDFKSRPVLIVGGGEVALRKIRLLKSAGADIHLVAPEIRKEVKRLLNTSEISERAYMSSDLDGVHWVIAATNFPDLNARIAAEVRERDGFVNVVDAPELGNFIFPAILERPPLSIAISSHGYSPVLVRRLRAKLETLIPAAYGDLADIVGRYRKKAQKILASVSDRRQFWESVLEGPIAEMVFSGKKESAESALVAELKALEVQENTHVRKPGEVYLVGAGPGDPDLLTFRALRLMQLADVVLYDRLVSQQILDMVRRDAELIYVGKQKSEHAVPQEQINQMLVDLALEGKRVCRLKGGDPFIFGRGGEEIDLLAAQGISFQVVPGITAASGCSTYAGIPLTHRDYAQSVCFVTGHLKDGAVDLNWETLVQPRQTLVIYMGLTGIQSICDNLILAGMSPDMPVALVEKGTTPDQRVIASSLQKFPEAVEVAKAKAPTLIIVGEVVECREKLSWFSPSKLHRK